MSSIKSALILDDKQFQSALKNATAAADKFGTTMVKSTATADAGIGKLNTSLASLNGSLSKLGSGFSTLTGGLSSLATAIAGVGMAQFVQSIFNSASAVNDMSKAFGLSVETTLELKAGFDKAGVSSEKMAKILNTLALSTDEAQGGSAKLQAAFEQLGINANQLSGTTLAERMQLISVAMQNAGGSTTALRAATDILGKGALELIGKWEDLNSGMVGASGNMGEMASQSAALDEANKRLEKSATDIKNAFTSLFGNALSDIADFVTKSVDAEKAAKVLALAIAGVASAGVIGAIKAVVSSVVALGSALGVGAAAAAAETVAVNANTTSVGANTLSRAGHLQVVRAEALARIASLEATIAESAALAANGNITAALAFAKARLAAAEGGLAAATAATTGAMAIQTTVAGGLTAALTGLATRIGALLISVGTLVARFALVVTAVLAINEAVKFAFGVDPIDFFATKLEKMISENFPTLYGWMEKIGVWLGMAPGKMNKVAEASGKIIVGGGDGKRLGASQDPRSTTFGKTTTTTNPRNKDDTEQGGKTSQPWLANVVALKEQYKLEGLTAEQTRKRLELQKNLVGAGEVYATQQKSSLDFSLKKEADLAKLDGDIAKMKSQIANGDAATAKTLGGQLAVMVKQRDAIDQRVDDTSAILADTVRLKQIEDDRLSAMDLEMKMRQQIRGIDASIADFNKSENDRKLAAIQQQITAEQDAAVKRRQAKLGDTPIAADEEAAIRDKVAASMSGLIAKQKELNEAGAASEATKFVLDLQNNAIIEGIRIRAEMATLTMTEDERQIAAIKTQNALLAEQEIARRRAKLAPGADVSTEEKQAIRTAVANTTQSQLDDTQRLIDKSREWSTGWDKAYADYATTAQNAAKQSADYFSTFTKGAEDALVNFVQTGKLNFKGLVNDMIAQFARVQAQKLMSSLLGGATGGGGGGIFGMISGLFGGGRATGGSVDPSKVFMVGERGPELFVPSSAGTIVPNDALGGGGSNITNVTYNINATDAQSFKQQLARDPGFLHAVVEQGKRSTPAGARR